METLNIQCLWCGGGAVLIQTKVVVAHGLFQPEQAKQIIRHKRRSYL